MKLINMTDFVLENFNANLYGGFNEQLKQMAIKMNQIRVYAEFLKQPLELGMFVPIDEDGNVYVDYKVFNGTKGTICVPYEGLFEIKANEKCKGWKYLNEPQEHKEDQRYYDSISYNKADFEYQKAKESVLFEGFEIRDKGNYYFIEQIRSCLYYRLLKNNSKVTIEKLLVFNEVTLTESAIKQLGL